MNLNEFGVQLIRAVKVKHLNRKNSPCKYYEAEKSSFSECVISKVLRETGCKVSNYICNVFTDVPQLLGMSLKSRSKKHMEFSIVEGGGNKREKNKCLKMHKMAFNKIC